VNKRRRRRRAGKNTPFAWESEKGKRQEESSFFEKKEAKKLCSLVSGSLVHRVSYEKSFFASFFQKKKTLPALRLLFGDAGVVECASLFHLRKGRGGRLRAEKKIDLRGKGA
jgi:hypothetical protein